MKGFTLLELLIALAVFAIMATMAYTGLDNVLLTHALVREKSEQLAKMQLAFALMQRDIGQIVNRPIHIQYSKPQAAVLGGRFGEYLIQLTRTGRPNPNENKPRSRLQRIAYVLEDEKLYRISWSAVDRLDDSSAYKRQLLEGVKQVEFNFVDKDNEVQTSWPVNTFAPNASLSPPRAIGVELETKAFGKIQRWFRVGADAPVPSVVNPCGRGTTT